MIGWSGLFGGIVGNLYCLYCEYVVSVTQSWHRLSAHVGSLLCHFDTIRTAVGSLLILGGNDGFQILTLPPLLSPVAIGSIVGSSRNLLSFVDGCLFHVISIHGLAKVSMWGLGGVLRSWIRLTG